VLLLSHPIYNNSSQESLWQALHGPFAERVEVPTIVHECLQYQATLVHHHITAYPESWLILQRASSGKSTVWPVTETLVLTPLLKKKTDTAETVTFVIPMLWSPGVASKTCTTSFAKTANVAVLLTIDNSGFGRRRW
jgi:hypothetical protein